MDASKKSSKMKRSQRVTEANISTFLGYVSKIAKKKRTVTFLLVTTKTLKKTNQVFNSDKLLDGDFGLCDKLVSRKDGFSKPFITLRTCNGFIGLIDVDDQVHITADKIIIKKGRYSETGQGIEIWKFA
jgi:hypothetical protein